MLQASRHLRSQSRSCRTRCTAVPFKSGYGDLDFLFRLDHVWPNLQRYPVWLLQTETPIVCSRSPLDFLRAHGYRPYLLLEQWEQLDFAQKFGSRSRAGELSGPPIVDINHEVRIYDPDDYARYRRGLPIQTERIWTRS